MRDRERFLNGVWDLPRRKIIIARTHEHGNSYARQQGYYRNEFILLPTDDLHYLQALKGMMPDPDDVVLVDGYTEGKHWPRVLLELRARGAWIPDLSIPERMARRLLRAGRSFSYR